MEEQVEIQPPKVIFIDAMGTLFGVRGSVGEVYAEIAQQFGVTVDAQSLNTAFNQVFSVSQPLIFPDAQPLEIPKLEFDWWLAIAKGTFEKVGALSQFTDFGGFFEELYLYFSTMQPWVVYPDVLPALEMWKQKGIEMGIISNFDSRIYAVLQELHLADFFQSITICSEVGAAKPNSQIFTTALQKHHCSVAEAWYIGDNYEEDYQGAKAVGMRAILLKRQ